MKLYKDFLRPFLFIISIPLLIIWVIIYLIIGCIILPLVLHLITWFLCLFRGQYIIFIYSNSPNWQDYIRENILPRLPSNAIILNWSERKQWHRFSLPVFIFYFLGGDKEYNPMAMVFRPFRIVKLFRFWKAFRDFKHGKEMPLKKLEQQLYHFIGCKNGLSKPDS